MAKAIEHRGHLAEATVPLKLKVYEIGKFPCPVQCAGCMILGVNRGDHNRLSLYLSDGSSWHAVPLGASAPSQALAPINLTPMVEAAVRQALPAVIASPPIKVIQGPQSIPEDAKQLANAMLELDERSRIMANDFAELMARVEFLEENAAAAKKIKLEQVA